VEIRRYAVNNRGELNPHAVGDLVKYEDYVACVAEIRSYFVKKLNALNQIMVDAMSQGTEKKTEKPKPTKASSGGQSYFEISKSYNGHGNISGEKNAG
jgi:hypothetical protein